MITDDRGAYHAAVARGIAVTRTLWVLEIAAEQDLLDFPTIGARLRAAGFYMPEDVVDEMLARDATRKATAQEPPPDVSPVPVLCLMSWKHAKGLAPALAARLYARD